MRGPKEKEKSGKAPLTHGAFCQCVGCRAARRPTAPPPPPPPAAKVRRRPK